MFVLVVDTSLMNVSIAAVVKDLDTTVSSVQSAIALEALVSAAFILISSKIGDLFGRKRAYVLGLLAYAIGALAMTLAQSLTAIIVFWAIIGGLGASLLLPAMQSLIHGNFEGAAQKKTYALVGAAAAIAAAVGPLLGGFVTTYLSWRVGFLLEVVVIAVVLSQIGLVKDVPYTGERQVDAVGAVLSVVGMGGVVLGILVWQEGGDYVVLLIAIGALALWALARWLVRRHRDGKVTLLDPDLFRLPHFRVGITGQMLQNITLGGAMIALPIFLQIKLEYDALETGLSLAPLSLTMFAVAILAGRKSGGRRPAKIIRTGFALSTLGLALIIPIVPEADSGWYLFIPLVIAGAGLGLLVSQLNNYTLAPIDDERISEAAGVNSASGSFGLSFGLAVAGGVLLATLSLAFTNMTNASPVIPSTQQQQIAQTLEDDAQVVSNTQLDELLADEPPAVREEILGINTDATNLALQVALLVPILAGLLGLFDSFRMMRLPDIRALGLRRSSGLGLTELPRSPACGLALLVAQGSHARPSRPAGLAEQDLDHGGERHCQDRAHDAEERARDEHGDDGGERRELDRLAVDDRVDDVVLDLLIDQLDDCHPDRGRGAHGQRDRYEDHRGDRGADLRDQVEEAGDHCENDRKRQPERPGRQTGDRGRHQRDRDVADQRGGDRSDRLLEHWPPPLLDLRRCEPEQPVRDRDALHQQKQRQERERHERKHGAEHAGEDAQQRGRRVRQPASEVLERVADRVVHAGCRGEVLEGRTVGQLVPVARQGVGELENLLPQRRCGNQHDRRRCDEQRREHSQCRPSSPPAAAHERPHHRVEAKSQHRRDEDGQQRPEGENHEHDQ